LNNQSVLFLQLSCKHSFHEKCAEKWLLECSNSCPLCRKIVDYSSDSSDSSDQFAEQLNVESMNNHNNMILETMIPLLLESATDDTQFYLLLSPMNEDINENDLT
jgi:hypothetical protein